MIGDSVRWEIVEAAEFLKANPDIHNIVIETRSLAGVEIEVIVRQGDTVGEVLERWGYQAASDLDPSPQDLYIYAPPPTDDPNDYTTFDRMPRELKEAVWYAPGVSAAKAAWMETVMTKPSPQTLKKHQDRKEFDANVRPHRVHRRERTDVLQGLVQGLVRQRPLRGSRRRRG